MNVGYSLFCDLNPPPPAHQKKTSFAHTGKLRIEITSPGLLDPTFFARWSLQQMSVSPGQPDLSIDQFQYELFILGCLGE